jgi:hypothetical protein
MSSVVSSRAGPELVRRWREQIARQQRRRVAQGPRGLAALGYLVRGPQPSGLVDLRRVVFVALCDRSQADGHLATRVVGFSAACAPWGVKIGGPEQSRFEKDLLRAPAIGGKARRFDLAHPDVLTLALDLDRLVERHVRFPGMPRHRQPRWPALWAAFTRRVSSNLTGAGPEFESTVRHAGAVAHDVFWDSRRTIQGLVAFPLPFVSHAWQQFTTIFADLKTLPKRQVIRLEHQAKNLAGFAGAIEFDLVHTRFSVAST